MEKRASIDIGSNSILLLIGAMEPDGIKILENESYVTGLGRDLDKNGKFLDQSMEESYEVFLKYKILCEKNDIQTGDVIVTATEASRVSSNAKDFFSKIEREIGFQVKIITGEAEAFFSTTGILFDKKIKDRFITIMDIGGASTELIKVDVEQKKILQSFSMPVGAVRMTNWRVDGTMESNLRKTLGDFSSQLAQVKTRKLYCVAGTMTSVGNIYLKNQDFVESEVNGLEFHKDVIDEMYKKFNKFSSEDFLKKFSFLGKRSQTIYSGIVLARDILNVLETNELYISTYGLRYGTLLAGGVKNDFLHGE